VLNSCFTHRRLGNDGASISSFVSFVLLQLNQVKDMSSFNSMEIDETPESEGFDSVGEMSSSTAVVEHSKRNGGAMGRCR
jgi:hypothetical protein